MSFSVDFPAKEMPLSTEESNWFAAHNPIVVPMQRRDYTVADTTNSGGKVKITTTGAIAETLTVNGYVYINSGAVKGVYKIQSVISTTEFVIDLIYIADTAGGFVNLNTDRPYYRVRVLFEKYDFDVAAFVSIGSGLFTPDSTGLMSADVSEYVSKTVSSTDTYDYASTNERDTNLSAYVKTQYQEEWTGNSPSVAVTYYMHVVHAAMQNGNLGGSNMRLFVTEPSGQDIAKWLCQFTRPTYWVGLPFDLQFIYALLMGATTMKVVELITNENGSTSTHQHTIDVAGLGHLNRVNIPSTYSPQAKTTEIKISDGSTTTFVEYITVDIIQCLPENPVYLKWLGANGSWNYYLFSATQTEGIDSKSGGIFERFTSDLELKRDSGKYLSKSSNPTLTMGAERLTTEKKDGLKSLLSAVQVEMYNGLDADDVPIWVTVLLTKFKFAPNTKNTRHSVELTIELPDFNIQTQ